MEESVEESDYLVESNRLATFKNWPVSSCLVFSFAYICINKQAYYLC